ncbi:MAG: RsmD family RNA methyltransferase [bacterium]|nr:RsmD family RNA methyltransferase [bacterium]
MKAGKRFEFQVVSGLLKGKKITAPDLGITRPPLSRLRKAIFDFLNPYIDDAAYLDLFSGTGSYLFEAVSRHARLAVGVELELQLSRSVNDQAVKFAVEDTLKCLCNDVFKAIVELHSESRLFDVIMIAPPQYKRLIDKSLALLKEHPLSTPDGIIVCQHDSSETEKTDFQGLEILQQRKYGNTTFTVLSGRAE